MQYAPQIPPQTGGPTRAIDWLLVGLIVVAALIGSLIGITIYHLLTRPKRPKVAEQPPYNKVDQPPCNAVPYASPAPAQVFSQPAAKAARTAPVTIPVDVVATTLADEGTTDEELSLSDK